MSRATYDEKLPGDPREAAWLNDFYADLATATGALDRDHFREEGLRLRNLQDRPSYGRTAAHNNIDLAPSQVWGALPGTIRTNWVGFINLKEGDVVRIRAGIDAPSDPANYGIPDEDMLELRISGTIGGSPWTDDYSEVWHQPGQVFVDIAGPVNVVSGNGLQTFATYRATADTDLTAVELEAQITSATNLRLGYGTIVISVFRRV